MVCPSFRFKYNDNFIVRSVSVCGVSGIKQSQMKKVHFISANVTELCWCTILSVWHLHSLMKGVVHPYQTARRCRLTWFPASSLWNAKNHCYGTFKMRSQGNKLRTFATLLELGNSRLSSPLSVTLSVRGWVKVRTRRQQQMSLHVQSWNRDWVCSND